MKQNQIYFPYFVARIQGYPYLYYKYMGNFTGFQKSQDYYQHPKLGLIKRIQTQDGPQFIEHKVIVESQEVVQEWKAYLQSLEHCGLREVLFIPHNFYFQRVGYCGKNGEAFLLFDDFMFCLKDEIQNRFKIRRPFPESTIIEILYRLAKAERDLEKLNLRIGPINSQSIMVNQDGDWRIISQHTCPHSLFTTVSQQQQNRQFLSPEELENRNKRNDLMIKKQLQQINETHTNSIKMQTNSNISQIFSIGMIILEISTLEPSQQIYKNGFNIPLLQQRIRKVETKFSVAFVNILKGMLELIPNQRIKCSQIVSLFQPYEKLILAHKQISFQFQPIAQAKTNVQAINNSTRVTSDNLQKQNNNPNRWKRFVNFFPFMHQQAKNNQEMNHRTIHRTSSCFGQRKSITVAGAN